MPAWILCFALIGLVYMTGADLRGQHRAEQSHADAQTIGRNLAIYRAAVDAYHRANPSALGTIPDSGLGLPVWFQKYRGVGHVIVPGRAIVYFSPPAGSRPALSSFFTPKEGGPSLLMGVARGGWLHSPGQATATISLPPAVPEGAIVFAL